MGLRRLELALGSAVRRRFLTAGGVFTPALLPALAPTILVAQSRAGKLWQNAAKTTPAIAHTDPVRVATCPYTGLDYTAPSDAARPTLTDLGNGRWGLTFDGVANYLVAPSNDTTNAESIFLRLSSTTASGAGGGVYLAGANGLYVSGGGVGNTWIAYLPPTVVLGTDLTPGTVYTIGAVIRAANDVDMTTDGATVNRTNGSGFAARGGTAVGRDPDVPANFFAGVIRALVPVYAPLSAGQVAQLNTYLSQL